MCAIEQEEDETLGGQLGVQVPHVRALARHGAEELEAQWEVGGDGGGVVGGGRGSGGRRVQHQSVEGVEEEAFGGWVVVDDEAEQVVLEQESFELVGLKGRRSERESNLRLKLLITIF